MSEHVDIAKKSDPGSPLAARILLITVLLSLFGAYVVDVYYR
jgi:hypothetical protein